MMSASNEGHAMYLAMLTARLDELAREIRASRTYDHVLHLRYALVQSQIHDALKVR